MVIFDSINYNELKEEFFPCINIRHYQDVKPLCNGIWKTTCRIYKNNRKKIQIII